MILSFIPNPMDNLGILIILMIALLSVIVRINEVLLLLIFLIA